MEKDEKAGFKPSNHHKYRVFRFVVIIPYGHTYATLLFESGVELLTISRALGHASIAITADIYTDVGKKRGLPAELMGGLFKASNSQ